MYWQCYTCSCDGVRCIRTNYIGAVVIFAAMAARSLGGGSTLPRCSRLVSNGATWEAPLRLRDPLIKNILIAPVIRNGVTHQVAHEGRPSATQRATHTLVTLLFFIRLSHDTIGSVHFATELDIEAFIYESQQRPETWDVSSYDYYKCGSRHPCRDPSASPSPQEEEQDVTPPADGAQISPLLLIWKTHISALGYNLIVVLFLAIIIFGMSGAQQTVTVDPRAVQETVKGNIDFTFSLYKILAKAKSGNIIVSPMSLEVVLAMAYFGARGETAEQIATGISLPAERNLALDGFRHLLSSFKSTSNLTLEIANKVFTQQNYVIKEDFQALVKKSFLSEAQALNFADNVVSAGVINQWVEEKTKNKIKDLISPDMLDSLTRLVMVNAVYFKGNWQDQFKPEMTTTEPFYVSAEVKKDVRMMHLKKHFRYSEVDELEAQVLELPYEERQVSMVILLPNDRNGLPNLEAKLTSEKLTEVLSQLHSTEVNVSIPRFKLEDTIDLNSVLQEMGMNNMFEDSADFSGITDDAAGLKVSQVVQKAFIEVNEEGSEAAAATGSCVARFTLLPDE
nr:unnamed protein product [Timema californicum]